MDTHAYLHAHDGFAMDMVNIKAAELVGTAGYTAEDFEDIRHDLLTDLIKRLPKFNPRKSDLKLFVTCVVDRMVSNLIRYRTTEMRDYQREECSLNEEVSLLSGEESVQRVDTVERDDQDIRTGKYRRPEADRTQLRLDVQAVLAQLAPSLRDVALMLQTQPVARVARKLGIARRTFRETHLAQLREAFTASGLSLTA